MNTDSNNEITNCLKCNKKFIENGKYLSGWNKHNVQIHLDKCKEVNINLMKKINFFYKPIPALKEQNNAKESSILPDNLINENPINEERKNGNTIQTVYETSGSELSSENLDDSNDKTLDEVSVMSDKLSKISKLFLYI